jgi:hypothetical protein
MFYKSININNTYEIISVIFLVLIFIFLSFKSAISESLTYDEIVYIENGIKAIKSQDYSIDPYNPPFIQELSVIPIKLGFDKFQISAYPAIQRLPERMVITLMGVTLLLAVYFTVRKYWGKSIAVISLALLAFEPSLLANSHYITLDTGTALFFFLTVILFISALTKSSIRFWLLFGLAAGALFAGRIFGLTYFFGCAAAILIIFISSHQLKYDRKWLIGIIIIPLVVWSVYFFKSDLIIAKAEYKNRFSARILSYAQKNHLPIISNVLYYLENQPVPLGNYLALIKNNLLRNAATSRVFFMGNYRQTTKFYFLPATIWFKTPLPFWVFLISGYIFLFTKKNQDIFLKSIMVVPPAVLFVAIVSGMAPLDRYALPLYPFLTIISAFGIYNLWQKRLGLIVIAGGIWYMSGIFLSYPHFITYANLSVRLIGPKYQIFSDSNLDWGQGLFDLQKYVKTVKPVSVSLSYFGRDNAAAYGFPSPLSYGSYRQNEICEFHPVMYPGNTGQPLKIISVSNWNDCGYRTQPQFSDTMIKSVVGNSFLVFQD